MPHSESPKGKSSPAAVKDEPMDDAAIPSQVEDHAVGEADVDMDQSQSQSQTQGRDEQTKKDVKLEDLFADVDSDDDFPSSAPVPKQEPASSPPTADLPR
jgi:DNA primase small subunit